MAAVPIDLFRIPARVTAGLHEPVDVDGRIVGDMTIPRALHEPDGGLSPAVLALLADGCLGLAVVHHAGFPTGMVTSHLHLEFPQPIPDRLATARCSAAARQINGSFGLAESTITDDTGAVLAYATLGAVLVAAPDDTTEARTNGSPEPGTPTWRPEHIDELFGTAVHATCTTETELRFRSSGALANLYKNLHGGMGALMGSRALDIAVGAEALRSGLRLADLRAVFSRPIPAESGQLVGRARLLHRGRRLIVGRAELLDSDQRIALTVDATYTNS